MAARGRAPPGPRAEVVARPAPGADRSVAVLELLAAHPEERPTLSEIARRCHLNKATAHALLTTLTDRGILLRHPDEKRYSLGPRLVVIGDAARRGYSAVDFAPTVVEELAARTGLWARAWKVVGDAVVCTAQAGAPSPVDGSAAVTLPLVPPLGALFMAWSDGPTVEAWLARATAGAAVGPAVEALPRLRHTGFGVTLASPQWRGLSQPAAVPAARGGAEARRAEQWDLLVELADLPVLAGELDDAATYRPCDVEAPVFGTDGTALMTVSVTFGADAPVRGAELRALGRLVAAAGHRLTAAVHGHRP